jgi:hypothetical protein
LVPRIAQALPVLVVAMLVAACGGSGSEVAVEVPDGWESHASVDLGYVMAHPADWDVAFDPAIGEDVYIGPDGTEIRVTWYVDNDGYAADVLFLGGAADARDRFGVEPNYVNDFTMAEGVRVRVFANQYTDDGGGFFFQRAVVIAPPNIRYVDWYSDVGDEGGDRQAFVPFLHSFEPAPLPATEGA